MDNDVHTRASETSDARSRESAGSDRKKLQVVGSYFVDHLYNNLHQKAKVDKIEYQDIMKQYVSAIRASANLLRRLVEDVYKYYKVYTHQSSLEYPEFLQDICYEITTQEVRKRIKREQEREFVTLAFYEVLSGLASFMTKPENIKNVIVEDNRHGDIAGKFTVAAREYSVNILLTFRTRVTNQFIEKSTGIKPATKSNATEIEKYKGAIKKFIIENMELTKKVKKYRRRIEDLEAELEGIEEEQEPEDEPRNGQPKQPIQNAKPAQVSSRHDRRPVDASFFDSPAEPKPVAGKTQLRIPGPADRTFAAPSGRVPNFNLPEQPQPQQPQIQSMDPVIHPNDVIAVEVPPQQARPAVEMDDSLNHLERMVENLPSKT